jgi:hypothetical protein
LGREKSGKAAVVRAIWMFSKMYLLGSAGVIGEVGMRTVRFHVFWGEENCCDFQQRWVSNFFRAALAKEPILSSVVSVPC